MTRIPNNPSMGEHVVDQQIRQVQNVQALQPINGPQFVGVDGSKTPPQVSTMVSPMDGELPRPTGSDLSFYRKVREIRRDPTIKMMRELAMAPLLMAEWEYEARPDAPMGAKELVTEIMNEMRLRLMRTTLCGQCDYGWQPYEVIAEQRRDGASSMRLKPLLQDITSILVNAADGSFFGLRQTPMIGLRIGWIYLLDQEAFVISQDVEGTNWYGEATLRSLEKAYDEGELVNKLGRKYSAKIAGTHWVIYFPLGTSDFGGVKKDNGVIATELLQQAEAVGGIAVPRSVVQAMDAMNAAAAANEATQWKIELLSDKGQGQTPFMEKLKYLDVLKCRAFGFPERAVLEGQFGTKAEAAEHADIAVSNLEVRHSLITDQYNKKLVDTILKWNYGPDAAGAAWIKPSPLADDKLLFFQKIYEALFANPNGFMSEVATLDMEQIRERLGLPTYTWEQMQQQAQQWGAWDPYMDPYGQGITGQLQSQPESTPGSTTSVNIPYQLPQTFSRLDDDVREAASQTHTEPSEAQIGAGNYRKGKVTIHGMRVSIENPRGTRRRPDWPKLKAHYGYIKRTEGSDGDHVDAFIGPHPESELVHVVDQIDKHGDFDEHKVMLGYNSLKKARQAYERNYPKNHKTGPITAVHVSAFKRWLEHGDTTQPFTERLS